MGGDGLRRAAGKQYNGATLMGVTGVSRTTLRYYEELGLIRPQRDDGSNYRRYANDDVWRIANWNILRSFGLSVADASALVGGVEGEPAEEGGPAERGKTAGRGGPGAFDAPMLVERCAREHAMLMARAEALGGSLDRMRRYLEADPAGDVRLVRAERWLFFADGCEDGYENFTPTGGERVQEALLREMPVSSFAILFPEAGARGEGTGPVLWGRAVPQRHAAAIPELADCPDEPTVLGGCICASMVQALAGSDLYDPAAGDAALARMRAFAADRGLAPDGLLCGVGALPLGGTFYQELLLPVRATGPRGAWQLRRLGA